MNKHANQEMQEPEPMRVIRKDCKENLMKRITRIGKKLKTFSI